MKTKYDIGQELYFMYKNRVLLRPVKQIRIYPAKTLYYYTTDSKAQFIEIDEQNCFSTKQELLDSL